MQYRRYTSKVLKERTRECEVADSETMADSETIAGSKTIAGSETIARENDQSSRSSSTSLKVVC